MISFIEKRKNSVMNKAISSFVVFSFVFTMLIPPEVRAQATLMNLPVAGVMVPESSAYIPVMIKGITVHPENPLEFDFIVNNGDTGVQGEILKEESRKLVKYFLASLTVPEKNLWVNLSPYEKDRIIPKDFGLTEMGRDLLAQDYILKQLASTMMYPEDELGKVFWSRVYEKALSKYGTTDIPLSTFNKIWIVPQKAVIYQKGNSAYVVENKLKVMLEEDYVAMQKMNNVGFSLVNEDKDMKKSISKATTEVIREVLIPEITKEVNEGKNFAPLRQMANSIVLAAWYKQNLKESLLGKVYVNKAKTKGIDVKDKQVNQKIYEQYIDALNKGVYNYIKEEYDPSSKEVIPRKYFSGGVEPVYFQNNNTKIIDGDKAMSAGDRSEVERGLGKVPTNSQDNRVTIALAENPKDNAKVLRDITNMNELKQFIFSQIMRREGFSKYNINRDKILSLIHSFLMGDKRNDLISFQINKREKSFYISNAIKSLIEEMPQLNGIIFKLRTNTMIDSAMTGRVVTNPLEKTALVEFGTSGHRGNIPEEEFSRQGFTLPKDMVKTDKFFDINMVRRLAQGTAEYMVENLPGKAILLAGDTRLNNKRNIIETAGILAANGIKVYVVNVESSTPTPVLAYLASIMDDVGGVINFTASHNPAVSNGFKFSPRHGGAADKDTTEELGRLANAAKTYKMIEGETIEEAYQSAKNNGLIVDISREETVKKYVYEYLIPKLKEFGAWNNIIDFIKNNNDFQLVLDPMQGTGVEYIKALYGAMAEEVGRRFFTIIHQNNKDPLFSEVAGGPRPDDMKSNKGLRDAVKSLESEGKKAFGIALDGDSDRFGTIDSSGEYVSANDLLGLQLFFLKSLENDKTVDPKIKDEISKYDHFGKTVGTSDFGVDIAKHFGMKVDELAVGFKWFVEQMIKNGTKYLVAGEESAHVGIGPFMQTWDDGFVVGLISLWIRAKTRMSLKEYKQYVLKQIGTHERIIKPAEEKIDKKDTNSYIRLTNLEVKAGINPEDTTIVKLVMSMPEMQGQEFEELILVDGIKIKLKSGAWLTVRPSGTEDKVKEYAEVYAGGDITTDKLLNVIHKIAIDDKAVGALEEFGKKITRIYKALANLKSFTVGIFDVTRPVTLLETYLKMLGLFNIENKKEVDNFMVGHSVFSAVKNIIEIGHADKKDADLSSDKTGFNGLNVNNVKGIISLMKDYKKEQVQTRAKDQAMTAVLARINPQETKSWKKLKALAIDDENLNLRKMFASDPNRTKQMSIELTPEIEVDFSKNLINGEVLHNLLALADEVDLKTAINQMFTGQKINETENRAVLHTALRNIKRDDKGKLIAAEGSVYVDGEDVMPKVISVLEHMEAFIKKVYSGEWKGASGEKITDVVNIGIGGSDLGPKMAAEALKPYKYGEIDVHFVSNIDGTAAAELMKKLNPKTTLINIVSKTFTTQETMQNAKTFKKWILDAYDGDENVIKNHFIASSTAEKLVAKFGIDTKNMFGFWDWVGGRFSVWSAVGLTLAIYIGFDNFLEFLQGGLEADEHFRTQPFVKNIPVLKALLNVWYGNFLGAESFAILPYDQYLSLFPAFAQQFFMESNGKSVNRNGKPVNYQTGLIAWGAAGTDGQHSFYQLIHQGTHLIPADFIGIINTHNDIPGHHTKLFSNFVAQTEALAFGATTEEVKAKLKNDPKYAGKNLDWNSKQQTFTGNKPTTSILIDRVTPRTLGSLVSLYEHQIFTEGILWNIFSFDQWGVQLGKVVAKEDVLPFLDGTMSMDELANSNLSPSGIQAIKRYLNRRKTLDQAMTTDNTLVDNPDYQFIKKVYEIMLKEHNQRPTSLEDVKQFLSKWGYNGPKWERIKSIIFDDKNYLREQREALNRIPAQITRKELKETTQDRVFEGTILDKAMTSGVKRPDIKRIGVLTGGGLATGHNSLITAAIKAAKAQGQDVEIVAIPNGWAGLSDPNLIGKMRTLKIKDVLNSEKKGGSILRSSRTNPVRIDDSEVSKRIKEKGIVVVTDKVVASIKEEIRKEKVENLIKVLKNNNIDGLIVMGGDDTNGVSSVIHAYNPDFPILGVPKTMDNDIYLPEGVPTYGYDSFIADASQRLRNLKLSAQNQDRIFVVELFGRDSGFTALGAASREGATLTLIPEMMKNGEIKNIDSMIEKVGIFYQKYKYGLIVISEGVDFGEETTNTELDAFGHKKLEGAGKKLADILRTRLKGIKITKAEKIAYATREAHISPKDYMITQRLGKAAVNLLRNGSSGSILYTDADYNVREMSFPDKYGVVTYTDADGRKTTMNISDLRKDKPGISPDARRKIGGRIADISRGGREHPQFIAANAALFGFDSFVKRAELELLRIENTIKLPVLTMTNLLALKGDLEDVTAGIKDFPSSTVKSNLLESTKSIGLDLSKAIEDYAAKIVSGDIDAAMIGDLHVGKVIFDSNGFILKGYEIDIQKIDGNVASVNVFAPDDEQREGRIGAWGGGKAVNVAGTVSIERLVQILDILKNQAEGTFKIPTRGEINRAKKAKKPVGISNEGNAFAHTFRQNFRKFAEEIDSDKAMTSENKEYGGINLDPKLFNLQIRRDGTGVPLPINQQPIEIMDIQGFVPIIINIQPINNLPLILGFKDTNKEQKKTKAKYDNISPIDRKAKLYIEETQKIIHNT